MSRYTKLIGQYEYAYGFDTPLGEYFFQKYDTRIQNQDDEVIFSIGSRWSLTPHPNNPSKGSYSNGELMGIIKQEEDLVGEKIFDPEHWEALVSDLPF